MPARLHEFVALDCGVNALVTIDMERVALISQRGNDPDWTHITIDGGVGVTVKCPYEKVYRIWNGPD